MQLFVPIAVDCGTLTDPANGTVDLGNGTVFNSIAFYSCQDNHTLEGNLNRTCMSNGLWSGTAPVCNSKSIGIFKLMSETMLCWPMLPALRDGNLGLLAIAFHLKMSAKH